MKDKVAKEGVPTSEIVKETKEHAKKNALQQRKEKLEEKPLHGQFTKRISKADVDKEGTLKWMKSAGLKGETEGLLIAAQDQCLRTKY